MNKEYSACIYARLSRDDGDKLESDSIINQRGIAGDCIIDQTDITFEGHTTKIGIMPSTCCNTNCMCTMILYQSVSSTPLFTNGLRGKIFTSYG